MLKPRILTIVAFVMITLLSFTSCVKDDDSSENPFADAVVIGEDGVTSNGSRFISCDDGSFFLNSVRYKVVDDHLAVVGCNNDISRGEAKIFPRITYKKNTYDVLEIEDEAFLSCSRLKSIIIPASVKNIGDGVFLFSQNLEKIVVSSDNTTYDSRDNCNAIIETATNKLIYGCRSTVIPDDVTSIGDNAFERLTILTTMKFPVSVESIGSFAFFGCTGLTSIELPEKLSRIGRGAFGECDGLTSITIPEGVTSIELGAFADCSALSDIRLSGSLTSINDYVFSGCSSLRSITIPEGVTQIGASAFYMCSFLASITIPASMTSVDERSFLYCPNITEIHCLGTTPPFRKECDYFGRNIYSQATLYVPQGCREAYESAFGYRLQNIVEE